MGRERLIPPLEMDDLGSVENINLIMCQRRG